MRDVTVDGKIFIPEDSATEFTSENISPSCSKNAFCADDSCSFSGKCSDLWTDIRWILLLPAMWQWQSVWLGGWRLWLRFRPQSGLTEDHITKVATAFKFFNIGERSRENCKYNTTLSLSLSNRQRILCPLCDKVFFLLLWSDIVELLLLCFIR